MSNKGYGELNKDGEQLSTLRFLDVHRCIKLKLVIHFTSCPKCGVRNYHAPSLAAADWHLCSCGDSNPT